MASELVRDRRRVVALENRIAHLQQRLRDRRGSDLDRTRAELGALLWAVELMREDIRKREVEVALRRLS